MTTEDDDEVGFGDFTSASPAAVNSIPKSIVLDPSLNDDDEDWGDFVKTPFNHLSRTESLPAKSSHPFNFFSDQQNPNSKSDNSATRTQWEKPKGALPLSLFGEEEKDDKNKEEEGSGVAGLLFSAANELKTNKDLKKDNKVKSDLNVSNLISNLYKQNDQSKGENGSKPDSKMKLKWSSNGLDSDQNGLDLKRSVSNLASNGLKWGLDEGDVWDFKAAETKQPAGDFNIKRDLQVKAENAPISNGNGFDLNWSMLGSHLNRSNSNLNGNVDANKSNLLFNESEDFEDNDDGWEFKVAESETQTGGDSNHMVNSKGADKSEGIKHTFGFSNGADSPTDLFAASDGASQKSGKLDFGFDFSKSSVTPNGISLNSFSHNKQKDDDKNGLNSSLVNGDVDNEENSWEFKDAFSETRSKDKGNEVKVKNHKGALPLSLFGYEEHETDDPSICQDALTFNPTLSTKDSTKNSPVPNVSINDLLSSLYIQAEKNSSVNQIESPSDNHLGSTKEVVDSNVIVDDGDFDDDSWEFKGAVSGTIDENQTSTSAHGDSHMKYSTKVKQEDYIEFYSKLKDELCIVAQHHLDNLKKAQSTAALGGEDTEVKALENEIQDLYKELHQDGIILKEPYSEKHTPSNICLSEFVEVLQDPKFHVLESEYHLSKRLSLAEKDWRAAIELLKHVASTSKILNFRSKEEQSEYVSMWFRVVSVCAQELRHGASIWKQSVQKNVHSQIVLNPQGKQYILALGEIYRAVEVLGSSAKLYKPWVLLSYADPTGLFTLLSECSILWSSSGLEEACQSISDLTGFEYNATAKELLESVKYIHNLDALTLHNHVFSGRGPTCWLSLLTAGTVPGMKMVIWNGENYFLTLANLWANLVSSDPPHLPLMHVG